VLPGKPPQALSSAAAPPAAGPAPASAYGADAVSSSRLPPPR
jgi:hypothetical protein